MKERAKQTYGADEQLELLFLLSEPRKRDLVEVAKREVEVTPARQQQKEGRV